MAGTINTTNYNFKKYAPDDTVSMLQTFNGNMDAIDKAIKDRADVETVQGASITKLENGLSSTNNGLNSANQTISAVQVQVTTNTRNIQTANTELDTLDARVQALEDGGSAIEKLNFILSKQPIRSCINILKQGNHVFGFGLVVYSTIVASDLITVSSVDNYPITGSYTGIKIASITNNLFTLNPNIGHMIGTATLNYTQNNTTSTFPIGVTAIYDGSVTYLTIDGNTSWTGSLANFNIDTII